MEEKVLHWIVGLQGTKERPLGLVYVVFLLPYISPMIRGWDSHQSNSGGMIHFQDSVA